VRLVRMHAVLCHLWLGGVYALAAAEGPQQGRSRCTGVQLRGSMRRLRMIVMHAVGWEGQSQLLC
jgi:hypothetical protein